MGARGPAPTPRALLSKRGSWRAKSDQGVDLDPGEPAKPAWLSDSASQLWDDLVSLLLPARILTPADGNCLARYCETWVLWRQADHDVRGGDTGQLKAFLQLGDQLNRLEAQLGLTPSARARVRPAKGPQAGDDTAKKRSLLKLVKTG